jgi:iron complex outermembrane recepter protein
MSAVPSISTTWSYEHAFDLANGGELKFRVNSKISAGYWLEDLQFANQYRQNGYTRTDATLGYTGTNGKLIVEAFVKNIENKVQMLATPYVPGGGYQDIVSISLPRTAGVRLTVKY